MYCTPKRSNIEFFNLGSSSAKAAKAVKNRYAFFAGKYDQSTNTLVAVKLMI
jgi:hypothetical protein